MVKSCKIWVISVSFPCHFRVISSNFPSKSSDLWPKVSLVTLLCEVGKIIGKSTLHEGFCWENHLQLGGIFRHAMVEDTGTSSSRKSLDTEASQVTL